jgi:hypothetical protein
MSNKIRLPTMASWLGFLLPLFALLHCGNAWGACVYQDIDVQNINATGLSGKCPGGIATPQAKYDDNGAGTAITDPINVCSDPPPTSTSVTWTIGTPTTLGLPTVNCTSTSTSFTCTEGANTMGLATTGTGLSPLKFSGKVLKDFCNF